MTSIFDGMTNLYSLSKTLRFELKPVGRTQDNLEKNRIVSTDIKKAIAYKDIKPILDSLHEEFINQSLSDAHLDISLYFDQRLAIYICKDKIEKRKLQDDKNGIQKTEKKLRGNIKTLFDHQGDLWKQQYLLKKGGLDVLSNDGMFAILKKKYSGKKEMDIIKEFDRFTTYFTGYNQNRANYYVSDEKDTAIANRIVHENLPKFCINIQLSKQFKNKITVDENIFELSYFSQCLSQNGIELYNKIIGDINYAVNQYNQKTGEKIKQLASLYKQIGCGLKKEFIVTINDKNHLIQILQDFVTTSTEKNKKISTLFNTIGILDTSLIYLSKKGLTQLSSILFGSWFTLTEKLVELKIGKFDKISQENKIPDIISLKEIITCIEIFPELYKDEWRELGKTGFLNVLGGYITILQNNFTTSKAILQEIINTVNNESEDHKIIIKNFADSALVIVQALKWFTIKESKVSESETGFYNSLHEILQEYHVAKRYDMLRNYLTKKPYSEQKMKLNFNKGNLLGGWPDSPEGNTQYCGMIFRKNGKYFLGITNNTRLYDKDKHPEAYTDGGSYEKMIYKQIDGKTIYGSSYKGKFGTLYSEDKLSLSSNELIKRIKLILEEKKQFYPELQNLIEKEYQEANELAIDIGELTLYSIEFTPVNEQYIFDNIKEGGEKCLYLFDIYNKDFGKKNKLSMNNLHTDYFLQLFSKNKEGESMVKLSGGAEIFYRPETRNMPKKLDKQGKEVIAHKRYSEPKYLLHLPILLNGNKSNKFKGFNQKINQLIVNNSNNICVIGIDRGEKHLAYYSVVNSKGSIIEQGSLNKDLLGKDYAEKLEVVSRNRDDARKNRTIIGTIKELKEGYISQVVKHITDLAIKHNALIVLEDLNIGFKRGRQKIEKSVYQKLELALAKKLNYVVQKDKITGPGSVLQAYQLAEPVQNFGDIKKQCGIMLYTRANYTSTTDPVTGWRKHLYLKTGTKDFMISELSKLDDVSRNTQKKCYQISYTYKGKFWILESDIERMCTNSKDKKHRTTENFMMTNKFGEIWGGLDKQKSILQQLKQADNNTILEKSIWAIGLLMQIRNSDSTHGVDCIISPVSDANGNKFDSRKQLMLANNDEYSIENTRKANLPLSGDANGSFNIARKGLMMIQKIKENTEKPDLYISDDDRDKWLQENQ